MVPSRPRLQILPTLRFRNTWSWSPASEKPTLRALASPSALSGAAASHAVLGVRFLYCDGRPELLFTENETNKQRLFNTPNTSPYVKDAFREFLIHGHKDKVNSQQVGTKAAALYQLVVPAGQSQTICLRISAISTEIAANSQAFGPLFDAAFTRRIKEADDFTIPSHRPRRAPMKRMRCGRHWRECSGANSITTWMSTAGWPSTEWIRRLPSANCETATGFT